MVADGFFLVFKSPPEGKTHIFRPGEPFAQIPIVPEEATFDLVPMSEEGGRRARTAVAAHFSEPQHIIRRDRMDLGDEHGLRRHISPYSRRGEREGSAATLSAIRC